MRIARSNSAFRSASSRKQSRGLLRLVHPDDRERVHQEVAAAIEQPARNTTRNSAWCGPTVPSGLWLPAEKSITTKPDDRSG